MVSPSYQMGSVFYAIKVSFWVCPLIWFEYALVICDSSFMTRDTATICFSKIRTWIDLAAYNSRKECDRGCIIRPYGWMIHYRWVIPSWVKVLFWHLYLHVRKVYWCTLECYRYLVALTPLTLFDLIKNSQHTWPVLFTSIPLWYYRCHTPVLFEERIEGRLWCVLNRIWPWSDSLLPLYSLFPRLLISSPSKSNQKNNLLTLILT